MGDCPHFVSVGSYCRYCAHVVRATQDELDLTHYMNHYAAKGECVQCDVARKLCETSKPDNATTNR